jgi:hypothetical protein
MTRERRETKGGASEVRCGSKDTSHFYVSRDGAGVPHDSV